MQPLKMKDPAFDDELASYKADLQVVVAFRMLPEVVWAMPRFGTFNVHAALLPQYRGAAPINWAIINGEKETGVTTFFIDKEIDTGRIILQKHFPIPDDANVEYVYDGLMKLGAEIAEETIDLVLKGDGKVNSVDQSQFTTEKDLVLHPAPKIFKETCQIDWRKTAKEVHDFVRGLSPVPGAWTMLVSEDNALKELKIFKTAKTDEPIANVASGTILADRKHLYVACADYWLEIIELQLSGKKRMDSQAFLNGNRNISDCHL